MSKTSKKEENIPDFTPLPLDSELPLISEIVKNKKNSSLCDFVGIWVLWVKCSNSLTRDVSTHISTHLVPMLPKIDDFTNISTHVTHFTQKSHKSHFTQEGVLELFSPYIKTLNDKVLVMCQYPIYVKDISVLLKEKIINIYKVIKRKDRINNTLYGKELIDYTTDKNGITVWYMTTKGKEYLETLKEEYENKVNEKVYENKINEYKKNKYLAYEKYIKENHINQIKEALRKDKYYLEVDFFDVAKNLIEMADNILEEPEEEMLIINTIVYNILADISNGEKLKRNCFDIRLKNIPKTSRVTIGEIRTEDHLGRFVSIPCQCISLTKPNSKTTVVKYECPACGNIMTKLMTSNKLTYPKECDCGRKGNFKIKSKEVVSVQVIEIEEHVELIKNRTNQTKMYALLKGDLTLPSVQPMLEDSSPLIVNGIIKEDIKGEGTKSLNELYIEVNNIEYDDKYESIKITEKEVEQIKEYSKNKNLLNKVSKYLAPEVVGRDKEKNALILSVLSGGGKYKHNVKDDMHVLLIGDPGTSKTTLVSSINNIFPQVRRVSGKETSGAGLTATVRKDELTGQYILNKGALSMINNGIVIAEELDKMRDDFTEGLHEPLEPPQKISIHKANIHRDLRTDNTFIATCNPKHGRFDKSRPLLDQIKFKPSLLSRFDLILIFLDKYDNKTEREITASIINKHQNDCEENDNDVLFIRKYLYYARTTIKPEIKKNSETSKYIENEFIKLRKKTQNDEIHHLTFRMLEAIMRAAAAHAKLHLRNEILIKDIDVALGLLRYSLKELNITDIDEIQTGWSKQKVNVFEDIYDKCSKNWGEPVNIETLKDNYEEQTKEKNFEDLLKKLKDNGDYYESKSGYIQKIK